jgi:DNA-binding response OmpR family regulator
MHILIAEDDGASRLVLTRTLEKLGYDVTAAVDGVDAWGKFQARWPSVVITDWMMPRLDGLDLCRRIRSDQRHNRYCYLMVLTALGGKQNYLEAMNAGIDDFMNKPFDPDELVTRLRVAERILTMEEELRYLAELHGHCSDCGKMKGPNGRWHDLRTLAATARPVAAQRCPGCAGAASTARVASMAAGSPLK